MKRINLLPEALKVKSLASMEGKLSSYLVPVFVLAIGLSVLHYGFHYTEFLILSKRYESHQKQRVELERQTSGALERTQKLKEQIAEAKKESQAIGEKQKEIENFSAHHYPWKDILAALNTAIPEKVWINHLVIDEKECRASGGTYNNALVSQLIERLNRSPYFSKAKFIRTEVSESDVEKLLQFELSFSMNRILASKKP